MRRRLTKSRKNVVITGTLGGIAEYFGIDATIVRIIYVLLSFGLIGSPIILYIVMALLIPAGNSSDSNYGHSNPYYSSNQRTGSSQKKERKQAEKVDDDDWSDF